MAQFLSGLGKSLNSIYKTVGSRLFLDELRVGDGVSVVHDMAEVGAIERWTAAGGIGPQAAPAQSVTQVMSLGLCQAAPGTLRLTASLARLSAFQIVVDNPTNFTLVMARPFLENLGGGAAIQGPPIFMWDAATGSAILYPASSGPFTFSRLLLNQLPQNHLPMMFYGYQQPAAPTFGNSRWTSVEIQATTSAFGAGNAAIAVLYKADIVASGDDRTNGYGLRPPG